ncbi:antibiotic biosynthesis monooxygenase family protein [Deinococcus marmoris]|uniref:antibiotic biosynthesis monooxygenase family protein n=1 Tax=Deinococcus marmoris TaxID=249408 RepID=UPI000554658B|nr:antibiotic biosynthesis monooxygenase [Deinococcus marmoris]
MHYAEARGDGAEALLRGFLGGLLNCPGFLGAELLGSPGQPGLYLVASRWATEVPELSVPGGVKAWSFEVLTEA